MNPRVVLAACLVGLALFGITPAVVAQSPAHPLVGKVLDTRTGGLGALTDAGLIDALFPCSAITLLGEVHDNPEHHRMRAALLQAGRREQRGCGDMGAVFEHIGADQQEALDHFKARTAPASEVATAPELMRRLDWGNSGWPAAELFEPLFDAVIAARLPIYPGSPSRGQARRIAKEGVVSLGSDQARQLRLDRPLTAGLDEALLAELEVSHCGLMPKSALSGMAMAQRYRDAHMAEVALQAATTHGSAVVFAGNGHVRTDRGIAYYMRLGAPSRTVISAVFAEVEDGKLEAAAYVPRDPAGNAAADYVAFAAPALRPDPCEAMRKAVKP